MTTYETIDLSTKREVITFPLPSDRQQKESARDSIPGSPQHGRAVGSGFRSAALDAANPRTKRDYHATFERSLHSLKPRPFAITRASGFEMGALDVRATEALLQASHGHPAWTAPEIDPACPPAKEELLYQVFRKWNTLLADSGLTAYLFVTTRGKVGIDIQATLGDLVFSGMELEPFVLHKKELACDPKVLYSVLRSLMEVLPIRSPFDFQQLYSELEVESNIDEPETYAEAKADYRAYARRVKRLMTHLEQAPSLPPDAVRRAIQSYPSGLKKWFESALIVLESKVSLTDLMSKPPGDEKYEYRELVTIQDALAFYLDSTTPVEETLIEFHDQRVGDSDWLGPTLHIPLKKWWEADLSEARKYLRALYDVLVWDTKHFFAKKQRQRPSRGQVVR